MNVGRHRFFVWPEQLDGQQVTFSPDQQHQLRHVLRLKSGAKVRVFDGRTAYDLQVVLDSPECGRVEGICPQAAEPRTRLVMYQALTRRDKFEQILQKLTELGIATVVPVVTARGVVRQGPDERQHSRWQAIIREAAEQCGRGTIPQLLPTTPFAAAIAAAVAAGTVLMAYERSGFTTLPLSLARERGSGGEDRRAQHAVSLFVGPEGGFEPAEADLATTAGAQLVTLGPRLLRTETAAATLAALVLYELGDLSSPPG
jgi:16S rRNA (uracil1498-N3)-methyltransferase